MAEPPRPEKPSLARRRFVTLRGERGRDEVDLEMPGDRPIRELIPDLLKALNWPDSEAGRPLQYQLRLEAGRVLEEGETLADAGVENSDVLWIALADPDKGLEAPETPGGADVRVEGGEGPTTGFVPVAATNPSPKDRRGSLAPPRSVHLDVREPSLISAKGWIFVLGQPPVSIGRATRGGKPDIDLADLDPEMVSSRLHAQILLEDGRFILKAEPTTNGTFLNGAEVQPFDKHPLQQGDVIQFGFEGVELTFVDGTTDNLPASFFRG
jgi:hypothetical protein